MNFNLEDIALAKGKKIQNSKRIIVTLKLKSGIVIKDVTKVFSEENSKPGLVEQVLVIDEKHSLFNSIVQQFNITSFEE